MKRQFITLAIASCLAFTANAQNKKKNVEKESGTIEIAVPGQERMDQVLKLINNYYVEAPDMLKPTEGAISSMLRTLDPHSTYISAKDVERANEGLQGNFEGVGIQFQIIQDTINVMDVIVGGPSEKVGIQIGDKILSIDGEKATGDTINNNFVFKRLRGKKGSVVKLEIARVGNPQPIVFEVKRGKVPIYSVDCHFMVDDTIGYIRLTRFARSSVEEFRSALKELKKQGLKALILDLRGNTGGYLDIACGMANEFLDANKLIVYTEGRSEPRRPFRSQKGGGFTQGNLVVLVDENSASASEIVSGCIQDWDRGLIVGRRTFGKGLVQHLYPIYDGAQLRLTTARYYTPVGRCIQKPYDKGIEAYQKDIENRYLHKEMSSLDSIQFPDSLKYKTSKGRTVYGGGGIMPDVFVPIDTVRLSDYFLTLRSKNTINTFALEWADQHRSEFKNSTLEEFLNNYENYHIDALFEEYAKSKGIKQNQVKGEWVNGWIGDQLRNSLKDSTMTIEAESYEDYLKQVFSNAEFQEKLTKKVQAEDRRMDVIKKHSDDYLKYVLKATVAKDIFGTNAYYLIMKDVDEGYNEAVRQLRSM